MYYIYKITNNINGKIYVGKTQKTIERRFYEHKLAVKLGKKQSKLYSAMKHYGVDNFSIEQLDTADTSEELCAKEIAWIKKLNSIEDGYNTSPGGDGGAIFNAKGYITMNKDNKNTFVKPEDVEKYQQAGWQLGGRKLGPKDVGKWIHKGDIQKRVKEQDLQTYLNAGWELGYSEKGKASLSTSHKNKEPWNKGKTNIYSQDVRDKISKSVSGFRWMNKDGKSLQVKEKDIKLYLDKGYKFGRLPLGKRGDNNE